MQRPPSPVFGRALPSEMVAVSALRGQHKSRARSPVAIGDPIDGPDADEIDSPTPEGAVKVAERIGKHIERLEKSVLTSLKKVKDLQHHLYPTMSDNSESRMAVLQMMSSFDKRIDSLCDQLRTLHFEGRGLVTEARYAAHVQSDASPIRPGRRLCASPGRTLQTWRI